MPELTQLGRYKIETHLGSGAYADVYRAIDTALNRTVALKVLKAAYIADQEAFLRFVQEAQVAAALFHPHIATVLDIGQAEGYHFLAMRFVDGASLDRLIQQRGPLPWAVTWQIIEQIGSALQFAHSKGLVHRDIKPQNIILSDSEGAVLTDFGLVKALMSSGMQTRSGTMIGTPQYMAPEIWRGQPAVPATDQYALACVLVELLTGTAVFEAPTPPAVMLKHFQPLEFPSSWLAGTPDSLEPALRKALNQEAGDRFESISAFVNALRGMDIPPKAPHISMDLPVSGSSVTPSAASRRDIRGWGHFERGIALQESDNHDGAIEAFTEAIKIQNHPDYYHRRSTSYHMIGKYDLAIADDTKAIQLDPNKADHYYSRGLSYHALRDYDLAIIDFDNAIRLDSGNAEYYYASGVSLAEQGEHDKAIAALDQAIQLNPKEANHFIERGKSYTWNNNFEQAIADFNRGIQLDPNSADHYWYRGMCYSLVHDENTAISDFTKAIQLDPNQVDYYIERAQSYYLLGKKAEAKVDKARARELGWKG